MSGSIKKYSWKGRLFKLTIVAIFLFATLYNLLLGSWFITKIAFPLISDNIKYNVAADAVEISLIRGKIDIKNFRFGPGWEPIVVAPAISVEFSLFDLISGAPKLRKFRADSPEVAVVRNQAGYYNVNKMRRGPSPPDPPGPIVFSDQSPLQIEINDIQVKNGRFRLDYISNEGNNEIAIDVTNIDVTVDKFRNGGTSNLQIHALGKLTTYSLELNKFELNLKGHTGFSPHFLPNMAIAEAEIEFIDGVAGDIPLNGRILSATGSAFGENVLNALTVKNIDLAIAEPGGAKTKIKVTGDLNFYPWFMTSTIESFPIDDVLFNYFNNYLEIPLRDFALETTNTFTLDYMRATLDGTTKLIKSPNAISADYALVWMIEEDKVTAKTFSANAVNKEKTTANFTISSPLTMNFTNQCKLDTQPVLKLKLNQLNMEILDSFFPFQGHGFTAGTLTAELNATPSANIDNLQIDGWGIGENLNLRMWGMDYNDLNGNFSFKGELLCDAILKMHNFECVLARNKSHLMVVQFKDSSLNLSTGAANVNALFSGLKEHLLDFQPLHAMLERQPKIAAFLKEMSPLELTATIPAAYDPESANIDFDEAKVILYSHNKELAVLNTPQNSFNTATAKFRNKLSADLIIRPFQLNSLSKEVLRNCSGLTFSDGNGGGKFNFQLSPALDDAKIIGEIQVNNASFNSDYQEYSFDAVDVNGKFSADINNWQSVKIEIPTFSAAVNQQSVLNASCLIERNFLAKNLILNGKIEHFNGSILHNFGLTLSSNLTANGELQLNYHSGGIFDYAGKFTADSILPNTKTPKTVTIKGELKASGTPETIMLNNAMLNFKTDQELLGDIIISGTIPKNKDENIPAKFNVTSERMDAEAIFSLLDDNAQIQTKNNEPILFFVEIPFEIDTVFSNITWGGDINAQCSGRISGHHRNLLFERFFLRFNGAEIQISGKLSGSDTRTAYTFLAAADDAELATILAPVIPQSNEKFYAAIRHMRLDISGDSIAKNGFWDTQNGSLNIDLAKVRLSHALGTTVIGRVLLLPFSIVVNLQEFLPLSWDRLINIIEITSLFKRFYDNTGAFEFESGLIELRSAGGLVNIDKFSLSGSPVKQFNFKGTIGMGSNRNLKLHSLVDVMNLLIPIEIDGTLDEPNIDYKGITPNILSANAERILDALNPLSTKNDKINK